LTQESSRGCAYNGLFAGSRQVRRDGNGSNGPSAGRSSAHRRGIAALLMPPSGPRAFTLLSTPCVPLPRL
jgi:hypothetical protein